MKNSIRVVCAAAIVAVSVGLAFAAPGLKGNGNAKGGGAIKVRGCQTTQVAPSISGTPETSSTEGMTYVFTPSASDANCDALSFSIAGKPSWAIFDATTGRLAGTPGLGKAGVYSGISISVSDGTRTTSLPAFAITVSANTAPTIAGSPPTQALEGLNYQFRPSSYDPDGQTLQFSIANKPGWIYFNAATGEINGTPTSTSVGVAYNIVISVSDGLVSNSLPAFNIAVSSANQAPTISGTPPTTAQAGIAYSFKPVASDPNGDALQFSIANRPAWATFNTATGQLAGTPQSADAGTYANIVISVTDGIAKVSLVAFSVTVQQVSNGSATLTWQPPTQRTDGTTLSNLAGYRIHYGNAPGQFSQTVTLNNAGITSYVVENLPAGTWYFAATAFDAAGLESGHSNVGSKTIS